MSTNKTGRNDPCPCGSGKKYKQCCMSHEAARKSHAIAQAAPKSAQAIQDNAEKHIRMADAMRMQGNIDAAIECYRQALLLRPDYFWAYNDLGNAWQMRGNLGAAIECYRNALVLKPDYAEAYNNLGIAFDVQGKTDDAIENFHRALALKPDYPDACNNLGLALQAKGKVDAAIKHYREAIALKPDYVEAHNNLGLVLWGQGKLDIAIESFRKALAIRPDYAEAHNNLGLVLSDQGRPDEAIESYRKALALRPNFGTAHNNMLLAMSYCSSPEQYLAEARRYGSRAAGRAKPYTSWHIGSEGREASPLRIGLLSGDLRMHAVGFFLENILAHLDPVRVVLVAYSTNMQEDALTSRIKPRFVAWNNVMGLSDEAIARRVHDDGIHILVDLAGHTAHNRLPVFAWKPAPVQVSWLGYWATTGMPGMDYFLADSVSAPESHRGHFSEAVWYLPDTRFCFTPPTGSEEQLPAAPPALSNGHITFGSFQKLTKINDAVLAMWGKVMQALPDARLRLQNKQMNSPADRERLVQRLASAGIAAERVIMAGQAAREDYLAAYSEVDIILDTFPYTGATTTCEALWMGVPVLTLAGDSLLARQGASLMACAGLDDWIASDEADYVAKALLYSADVERLARLRAGLRERVLASPLFDGSRFARNLEDAFEGMWQQRMRRELAHA